MHQCGRVFLSQHFLPNSIHLLKAIVLELTDFLNLFSVFERRKATIKESKSFIDHVLESVFWIAPNWP